MKSITIFWFCVLFLGTSARSIGAQIVVRVLLYSMSTTSTSSLYEYYSTRISTEVQIELEIKTTLICIQDRSGIFPVCFERNIEQFHWLRLQREN